MSNSLTLSNISHLFSLTLITLGPQEYIKNTHYLPHKSISSTHTHTRGVTAQRPQTDLWPRLWFPVEIQWPPRSLPGVTVGNQSTLIWRGWEWQRRRETGRQRGGGSMRERERVATEREMEDERREGSWRGKKRRRNCSKERMNQRV